jgi:hypothetical protein
VIAFPFGDRAWRSMAALHIQPLELGTSFAKIALTRFASKAIIFNNENL